MRPRNKRATDSGHGIPRRAGSALSLRAGARSGTSRKTSKRRTQGSDYGVLTATCLGGCVRCNARPELHTR
ncbi:hypothetical protein G6F22_021133 [Rhizopus arrhizus]|nr:hypothetical protein G6F22_021133 [Rhizopus arrhizus]